MEFRVLGPLEVLRGGAVPVGGAKQRALLAALLLRAGEVVPVARLIDDIWGDSPPPSAAHSLEAYVSRLRQLFNGHARHSSGEALVLPRSRRFDSRRARLRRARRTGGGRGGRARARASVRAGRRSARTLARSGSGRRCPHIIGARGGRTAGRSSSTPPRAALLTLSWLWVGTTRSSASCRCSSARIPIASGSSRSSCSLSIAPVGTRRLSMPTSGCARHCSTISACSRARSSNSCRDRSFDRMRAAKADNRGPAVATAGTPTEGSQDVRGRGLRAVASAVMAFTASGSAPQFRQQRRWQRSPRSSSPRERVALVLPRDNPDRQFNDWLQQHVRRLTLAYDLDDKVLLAEESDERDVARIRRVIERGGFDLVLILGDGGLASRSHPARGADGRDEVRLPRRVARGPGPRRREERGSGSVRRRADEPAHGIPECARAPATRFHEGSRGRCLDRVRPADTPPNAGHLGLHVGCRAGSCRQ